MPHFKKYKLGDVASFSQGIQIPIDDQVLEPIDGYVRFIRIVDYTDNSPLQIRYIKNPGERYQVRIDDLVMIRYGSQTAGKIARGFEGAIANNTFKITLDENKIDKNFAYFLLSNQKTYEHFQTIQGSSTMPAITFGMAANLDIELPDLPTQTRIASILSSLDDKIELNRRTNHTLEQIAQTLFKKYFVDDIDPENLPKGWINDKIGNHVNTILGGTPSTTNEEYWQGGNIPWINSGKANEFRVIEPTSFITEKALRYSNTKLLPKGTTIIAITGATMGQISRLELDSCANQSIVGVLENETMPSEFIYFWLKQNLVEILSHATGGAQQHINKNNINDTVVVVPLNDLINNFKQVTRPIFEKISLNCFENLKLQKIRDSLLPKLMSGEIEVNTTEKELVN